MPGGSVRCRIAAAAMLIAAGTGSGGQAPGLAFIVNREITAPLQDMPANITVLLVDNVGPVLDGDLPVITSLQDQADAVGYGLRIVPLFELVGHLLGPRISSHLHRPFLIVFCRLDFQRHEMIDVVIGVVGRKDKEVPYQAQFLAVEC